MYMFTTGYNKLHIYLVPTPSSSRIILQNQLSSIKDQSADKFVATFCLHSLVNPKNKIIL